VGGDGSIVARGHLYYAKFHTRLLSALKIQPSLLLISRLAFCRPDLVFEKPFRKRLAPRDVDERDGEDVRRGNFRH
jgi:hypothetical protein